MVARRCLYPANVPRVGKGDAKRGDNTTELAIDTTSSVVGALVGFAIGGPVGAVVGGAAPPLMARAGRITANAFARRSARAERIATVALASIDGDIASGINRLDEEPELADTFLRLLGDAVDSDDTLSAAFGSILGEVIRGNDVEIERAVMVADSLRGLRATQLRILQAIAASGGELSASDIAEAVGIPEVELRGAVRNLEARGMIKDLEVHPVRWRLRELGEGVVRLASGPTQ